MSRAERPIPLVGGLISGFPSVHGLKGAKVFGTECKHEVRLKYDHSNLPSLKQTEMTKT